MALIKTVKKIKTFISKYGVQFNVFEFNPNLKFLNRDIKYLTGGICKDTTIFTAIALFESDENGEIIDDRVVILEEDSDYFNIFKEFNYTLIN